MSDASMELTHPVESTGFTAESGRGLGILDALAASWGTHRRHRTTRVWFTVNDNTPVPESPGTRIVGTRSEWIRAEPAVDDRPLTPELPTSTAVVDAHAFSALRRVNLRLRRSGHHDRAIARALQDAMLTRLPTTDNLELAVRYLTADSDDKVGGDWYDAIVHPSGATTLVIGDVMGHDIAAAAIMGQMRNLLRGIVVDRDEMPAALLTRLDHAMHALQIDTLVTVLVMRVAAPSRDAPGDVQVRWANAGHPSPVVVPRDAPAHLLPGRSDLLLGVDRHCARSDHFFDLSPGSGVVLYTDGLVERRDQDAESGEQELLDAVSAHRRLPCGQLLDAVLADTVLDRPADDVALLAARSPMVRG